MILKAKKFTSLSTQVQSDWYFNGQAVDVVVGETGAEFVSVGESLALTVPNNSVEGATHVMVVYAVNPEQIVYKNGDGQLSVVFPNTESSVLEGWGVRVTGRVE